MVDLNPTHAEVNPDAVRFPVDFPTPWMKNTPLHIAVKNKEIKIIKALVWDLNANPEAKNGNDKTPIDYCKQFIKDEET